MAWKDISNFRKKSSYVWHEDISGRVMLVPKSINNLRLSGIPHYGAVAAIANKNVNALTIYEIIKQLRR